MKKPMFVIMSVCLLSYGVLCVKILSQQPAGISKDDLIAIRKPDGLHRASLSHNGKFTIELNLVPFVRHDSLKQLASESDAIVAVTSVDNHCKLIDDGRGIITVYSMVVDQVFDSSLSPGNALQVSIPGGHITFTDGSWAQVNWPKQQAMLNGRRYLLFLRKNAEGGYAPVGGDEGVFELTANDTVKPFVWEKRSPLAEERSVSVAEFQEHVARAARK